MAVSQDEALGSPDYSPATFCPWFFSLLQKGDLDSLQATPEITF